MYVIKTNPQEQIRKREKRLYNYVARPFARIFSFAKKVQIEGLEHRVAEGPNAIISPHGYEWDDIAAIFRAYSKRKRRLPGRRIVFFTANKELFSKEDLMYLVEKNIKRRWGPNGMEGKILGIKRKNLINPFVNFFTSKVKEVGTILVDIRGKEDNYEAKEQIKDYLSKGRAIAFIQYYSKAKHKSVTPLFSVKKGGIWTLVELYEDKGVDTAITILTLKKEGRKYKIKIAPPKNISDYYVKNNSKLTVNETQSSLENKMKEQYHSL